MDKILFLEGISLPITSLDKSGETDVRANMIISLQKALTKIF
jgi:hypothetical protein